MLNKPSLWEMTLMFLMLSEYLILKAKDTLTPENSKMAYNNCKFLLILAISDYSWLNMILKNSVSLNTPTFVMLFSQEPKNTPIFLAAEFQLINKVWAQLISMIFSLSKPECYSDKSWKIFSKKKLLQKKLDKA